MVASLFAMPFGQSAMSSVSRYSAGRKSGDRFVAKIQRAAKNLDHLTIPIYPPDDLDANHFGQIAFQGDRGSVLENHRVALIIRP